MQTRDFGYCYEMPMRETQQSLRAYPCKVLTIVAFFKLTVISNVENGYSYETNVNTLYNDC